MVFNKFWQNVGIFSRKHPLFGNSKLNQSGGSSSSGSTSSNGSVSVNPSNHNNNNSHHQHGKNRNISPFKNLTNRHVQSYGELDFTTNSSMSSALDTHLSLVQVGTKGLMTTVSTKMFI
jgi:hypothetical protein